MAACKQMLEEARPVFYSINSFFIERRAVLSHHLKATPQSLRRLKLHNIKHVVLDGCAMLNVTRIAELKRLRCLETLTVFELRFHRRLPGWNDQTHSIIIDVGRLTADLTDVDNRNTQGDGMTLSRTKNFVETSCCKPTVKTMMLMRPNLTYQVIYQGALDWILRSLSTSRYLVTFIVSWDPEKEQYVFQFRSMKEDGCYLAKLAIDAA